MSPQEFDELNRNLAGYKNDPLFQEKLATTLGPEGTLDFWADLSDPSDGGDLQRARLDQLGVWATTSLPRCVMTWPKCW
ncbi:hypothetical protein ACFWA5_22295 [Streptomyces mirabilis]|uniref:hypothetical protein n=1 Tax=Streptomyces mirabilis TaxID=68239 RepID=UPI003666E8CA